MTARRGPVDRVSPALLDLLVASGIARETGPTDSKGKPMSEASAFRDFFDNRSEDVFLDYLHALSVLSTVPQTEVPHPVQIEAFPYDEDSGQMPPYTATFADGSRFYWYSDTAYWTTDFTPLSPDSLAYRVEALLNPNYKSLYLPRVEEVYALLSAPVSPELLPTRVSVFRSPNWEMEFEDCSVLVCNSIRGLFVSPRLSFSKLR